MTEMEIRISAKGDPPIYPFPHHTKIIVGVWNKVGILQGGMDTVRTSFSLLIDLPDGSVAFVETSARIWDAVNGAIKGANLRWGE
jgi:hypothetical protein